MTVFTSKCISSLTLRHSTFKPCRLISHIMLKVLGNTSFDFEPKVKGQIMSFLVNLSSPELLVAAT